MSEQTNGNLALVERHTAPMSLLPWTEEQKRVVKNIICPGINDDEMIVFAATCARTGLDPFSSPPMIYAYVRNQKVGDKWERRLVIVTGINGFRSTGESTGEYVGMEGPYWCGEDGVWKEVWLSQKPPVAAKVGILRKGFAKPVYGIATYRSFYDAKKPTWNQMPDRMLAVCAEREGWAKTFPRKCGGMYVPEEMPSDDHQAVEGTVVSEQRQPPAPVKASEPPFLPPGGKTWAEWCKEMAHDLGTFDNAEDYLAALQEITGRASTKAHPYTPQEWAKVAHKFQSDLWAMKSDDEAMIEDEASLAKMAGLDDQTEAIES